MNALASKPYAVDTKKLHGSTTVTDVNTEWRRRSPDERFLSIEELIATTRKRARDSETFEVSTQALRFDGAGEQLRLHGDGREFRLNHHAFRQLCSLSRLPEGEDESGGGFFQSRNLSVPAGFVAKLPATIAADVLNSCIAVDGGRDISVLHRPEYAMPTIRAVTSRAYSRIWDHEVAELAGDLMADLGWKVPGCLDWRGGGYNPETPVTDKTTTLFGSQSDVFIFIVDDRNPIAIGKLPNGDPELVFRGIILRNSEVGSAKLEIKTMLMAAVCCNRIIWGASEIQDVSIRHIGKARETFHTAIKMAVHSFARGQVDGIVSGINDARAHILIHGEGKERTQPAITFLRGLGLSERAAATTLLEGAEQLGHFPTTRWDMVNALTAQAQRLPLHEQRWKLEQMAGTVLAMAA